MPLPSRHEQVEQDRAPDVLPHHRELAGPPAGEPGGGGEPDRAHDDEDRLGDPVGIGRGELPDGSGSQGNGILSYVLSRTFSLYSSLKAHLSRLVSIPRWHPVSRLSSPRAKRRITLRFAAAWPVRTRQSSSRKLTSNCQCRWFSILQWPRTASANSSADRGRLRM